MNISDAIGIIESLAGVTDESTPAGEAWAVIERNIYSPEQVQVNHRLNQMEDLAADAVSGLRYIEQQYGRLYGVGWDRVYEKADKIKPTLAPQG